MPFALISLFFPGCDFVYNWEKASSPQKLIELQELANKLGVSKRCQFLGFVTTEEWQKLLWQATILVIPHPLGEFSKAAFPTKLAEYLASGTPVVSTRVGEIDHYLTDGVNIYWCPLMTKLQWQKN